MRIQQETLQHPTQASLVRLNVFEMKAPPAPVYGMDTLMRSGRFLVTEDRIGTTTVVATIGSFATREQAQERVRRRVDELLAQRYTRLPATA
jgi:hypothetical protein